MARRTRIRKRLSLIRGNRIAERADPIAKVGPLTNATNNEQEVCGYEQFCHTTRRRIGAAVQAGWSLHRPVLAPVSTHCQPKSADHLISPDGHPVTATGNDFILNVQTADARERLGDNVPPLPEDDPDVYLDLLRLAGDANDAGDTEPPAISYEAGSETANATALRTWNQDRQTRWQDYRNSSGYNQRREAKNAAAALAGAVTDLAECPGGQRNSLLNAKAWKLGRFVNAGLLDRSAVESALLDACRGNDLLRDDGERAIRATMASGLDSAARAKAMPFPLRERPRNGKANISNISESSDSDRSTRDNDEPDLPPLARSWMPVDLADVLDGTWQPPTPTVGRRSDGVGLFYPGKKHTVSSESEAGKTWFALAACRDEILRENHVFYYDFEDDKGPVVARLMLLGVNAKQIGEFFHYVRPETPIFLAPHGVDVADTLDRYRPTLAILDGVTEAMTLHELNPLDNADAAKFGRMVPRLLAESGAAAVSLDHVTKSAEGRGRYSIGAVHKLNGLDGAAYILDNRRPFGVGLQGVSTVRIAKDRPGQLRSKAVPSGKGGLHWFADLIIDTTLTGMTEGVVTVAPSVDRGTERRPTVIMGRICDALADRPEGLAQRVLGTVVTGKTDTIREALDYLIADGYVTPRTPHKLIRPYLPDEQFEDDDYADE